MTNETAEHGVFCENVRMTPAQSNEVIEDKLLHLRPVMECALSEITRVRDILANGEISWRRLLDRALGAVD